MTTREHGATMVEYALVLLGIAIVVAVAVTLVGEGIAGIFEQVTDLF